jgi:hypothetical protein
MTEYYYYKFELEQNEIDHENDFNNSFIEFANVHNEKYEEQISHNRMKIHPLNPPMIMFILIYKNDGFNKKIKMRKDTMKRLISLLKPIINPFFDFKFNDLNSSFVFKSNGKMEKKYNKVYFQVMEENGDIIDKENEKLETMYLELIDKYFEIIKEDENVENEIKNEFIEHMRSKWSYTAGSELSESPIVFRDMINLLTQELVNEILTKLFYEKDEDGYFNNNMIDLKNVSPEDLKQIWDKKYK